MCLSHIEKVYQNKHFWLREVQAVCPISPCLHVICWDTNVNCRWHLIWSTTSCLHLWSIRSPCRGINYCQTNPTIWNFIPSIYMHSNNICWEIISIRSRTLSLWSPVAVLLLLYLNISYKWIRFILAALS